MKFDTPLFSYTSISIFLRSSYCNQSFDFFAYSRTKMTTRFISVCPPPSHWTDFREIWKWRHLKTRICREFTNGVEIGQKYGGILREDPCRFYCFLRRNFPPPPKLPWHRLVLGSESMYVLFMHSDLFPFSKALSCQQCFCGDFVSSATINRTHCWINVAKMLMGPIFNLTFFVHFLSCLLFHRPTVTLDYYLLRCFLILCFYLVSKKKILTSPD
jgi:hypothetical protein